MSAMKQAVLGLFTLVVVSLPLVANAGDPAKGLEIVKEKGCAGCHGEDGNSVTPTFPILAGQYEDYLIHALKQYRDGERKIATMAGFSAGLSNQDILDVAAWYASNESKLDYVK